MFSRWNPRPLSAPASARKPSNARCLSFFPKDAGPAPPPVGSFSTPFPPRQTLLVPTILCYRPLYFEEKNTERYGWTVPGLQPLISTGYFLPTYSSASLQCGGPAPLVVGVQCRLPAPRGPVPYSHYLLHPPGCQPGDNRWRLRTQERFPVHGHPCGFPSQKANFLPFGIIPILWLLHDL